MFRGVLLKGSGAWQGGRDASLAAKLVKEACTSERASELVKEIVSEVIHSSTQMILLQCTQTRL